MTPQTVSEAKTRRDLIEPYAVAITTALDSTDWPAVNRAIIARWSKSALEYIKVRAWRIIERPTRDR